MHGMMLNDWVYEMKYHMLARIKYQTEVGPGSTVECPNVFVKGRTENGSHLQASLYPLYFVTIFIRRPIHQTTS